MKNPKETRTQPTFFPNWGLPKVPCDKLIFCLEMSSDFNFFGLVAEKILELRHKLTINVDVLALRKYCTPTVNCH